MDATDTWVKGASTPSITGLQMTSGKSFMAKGFGSITGTAIVPPAGDGAALGKAFTYRRKDKAGTACIPHYMVVQVGVTDTGKTNANNQKVHIGAAEAAYSFDALTTPAAATAPQTPSTGASMLAAGAATVAVAMTLF